MMDDLDTTCLFMFLMFNWVKKIAFQVVIYAFYVCTRIFYFLFRP